MPTASTPASSLDAAYELALAELVRAAHSHQHGARVGDASPARGAVPEIVEDGITGVICDDATEMVAAARIADKLFNRERIRKQAVQRWSAGRMADEYLRQLNNELYEAKTSVASAMADAMKLNTKEAQYTAETDQWASKAEG